MNKRVPGNREVLAQRVVVPATLQEANGKRYYFGDQYQSIGRKVINLQVFNDEYKNYRGQPIAPAQFILEAYIHLIELNTGQVVLNEFPLSLIFPTTDDIVACKQLTFQPLTINRSIDWQASYVRVNVPTLTEFFLMILVEYE